MSRMNWDKARFDNLIAKSGRFVEVSSGETRAKLAEEIKDRRRFRKSLKQKNSPKRQQELAEASARGMLHRAQYEGG